MGDPMHVYPDPNDGGNNAYVPSNTATATGAIVSGAVAVGAAAPAIGGALITNVLAFIQTTPAYQGAEPDRFMGLHGLGPVHIAIILFFGSLSVLLQVINLVNGLRMKERLLKLSRRVCQECEKPGGVFDWWKGGGK
ncbi:MAG TPA: hypothetical protein VFR03_11020 [Thermoanaerobaculia bacterium]|nr:hypothetical protein [Thermoanaerobaculia bacterium]